MSEWKKELIKLLKAYKKENILIMSEIRITDWNTFRINQFIKGNKIRTIEFTDLELPFYDYKFKSLKKKIINLFAIKIKKVILKKLFIFLRIKLFSFLKKIFRLKPNYFLFLAIKV